MANEVAIRHGGGISTDAMGLAQLQDTIQRVYASIESEGRPGRFVDRLPQLPTPPFRRAIQDRRVALHAALRPISMASAEVETVRRAVAAFLGGYLNIKTENPAAIAAGYTAHLSDQPLFAILAALDDFKHQRVVDRHTEDGRPVYFTLDHAPSAYRLLAHVKKCAEAAQVEHHQINRILAITKTTEQAHVSPEERQRVGEAMAKLAGGMVKRITKEAEADRQKTRAEAQEARDRAERIIQDAKRRNSQLDAASQEQAIG